MGGHVNIDDYLGDSRLWEGRAKAAARFGRSTSHFDNSLGGLVAKRHRKKDGRQVLFFIPALWTLYAVKELGMEEYGVGVDQLDYLRHGARGDDGFKTNGSTADWRNP